jgi:DNA-binding Xre family transcriptional regulator
VDRRAAAGSGPAEGAGAVKWNLRLAAANRGIWKASELQRMLADAGLKISAGKMSGLWSGRPASIKLSDLEVICAVVGCGVEELLIPEPGRTGPAAAGQPGDQAAATPQPRPAVTPRRRDRRSLPPS